MSQCIDAPACLHRTVIVKHVGRSLRVHVSAHVPRCFQKASYCELYVHSAYVGGRGIAFRHTGRQVHTHTYAIRALGGIKGSSLLKEFPIRAGVYCHPLGVQGEYVGGGWQWWWEGSRGLQGC